MLPLSLRFKSCLLLSLSILLLSCTSGLSQKELLEKAAKSAPKDKDSNLAKTSNQKNVANPSTVTAKNTYNSLSTSSNIHAGENPTTEPVKASGNAMWLLIDTQKSQLEVKRGEQTLTVLKRIAIGRRGAGFKNQRGDDITPLGNYKIGWINRDSPYHVFYGLTYPTVEQAETALAKGLIDQFDYDAIVDAHKNNRIPPQDTPLGGRIGLHGLGEGDEQIHELFNWTHGCIAITNDEIDQLSPWLEEGMEVKIK